MHGADPYPTRRREVGPAFPRLEPVIHSRNQNRWDGPLDEFSLSRYERDGFLWFEGFFASERILPFFQELTELERNPELMASDQIIKDPESGELRSVFAMHELSEGFSALTRDPRILGMVRQLLGGMPIFTSRGSTTSMASTATASTGTLISKPGTPRTGCRVCGR
ncbi:phytanoyl-CoA dioxygenase family protein [Kineobactrum salinum]|uniref:phytanoyl-CoA dioxygenase family protein n=1 Tax=Kineobactrum salinum TaxID=2708301 RepID=UPI001E4BF3FD|nr:phytanoyl-CoA dioxygenase family protein [Kineobactrum salinum]